MINKDHESVSQNPVDDRVMIDFCKNNKSGEYITHLTEATLMDSRFYNYLSDSLKKEISDLTFPLTITNPKDILVLVLIYLNNASRAQGALYKKRPRFFKNIFIDFYIEKVVLRMYRHYGIYWD